VPRDIPVAIMFNRPGVNGLFGTVEQSNHGQVENIAASARMSAMGQKQTLHRSNAMSALPPNADIIW
jgi:hypothetical protein